MEKNLRVQDPHSHWVEMDERTTDLLQIREALEKLMDPSVSDWHRTRYVFIFFFVFLSLHFWSAVRCPTQSAKGTILERILYNQDCKNLKFAKPKVFKNETNSDFMSQKCKLKIQGVTRISGYQGFICDIIDVKTINRQIFK